MNENKGILGDLGLSEAEQQFVFAVAGIMAKELTALAVTALRDYLKKQTATGRSVRDCLAEATTWLKSVKPDLDLPRVEDL